MDGIWSPRRHGDHLECLTSKGKKFFRKHRQQQFNNSNYGVQQPVQYSPLQLSSANDKKKLSNLYKPHLSDSTCRTAVPVVSPANMETVSKPKEHKQKHQSSDTVNEKLQLSFNAEEHGEKKEVSLGSSSSPDDVPRPSKTGSPSHPVTGPSFGSNDVSQNNEVHSCLSPNKNNVVLEEVSVPLLHTSNGEDVQNIKGVQLRNNSGVVDVESSENNDKEAIISDKETRTIEIKTKKSVDWLKNGGVEICWKHVGVSVPVDHQTKASYVPQWLQPKTWLQVDLQHNKTILSGVSGRCLPGQLCGVMGSSGSGKTSLLNALSGRVKCEGSVTIAGRTLSRKFRHLVGYSLQQDLFHPQLKLRQMLEITANLRLPASLSRADKMTAVDSVIEMLELTKCQDTVIGDATIHGLSGGERKRASIACELLTDPPILVLDEPTSGLDSHSAHGLMSSLKKLAVDQNKAIIMSLHQPSSKVFHMLDSLLLLCSGQPAYFGSTDEVVPYLNRHNLRMADHYNPADYLLEVAHDHAHKLVQIYRSNCNSVGSSSSSGISEGRHSAVFIESETSAGQSHRHQPRSFPDGVLGGLDTQGKDTLGSVGYLTQFKNSNCLENGNGTCERLSSSSLPDVQCHTGVSKQCDKDPLENIFNIQIKDETDSGRESCTSNSSGDGSELNSLAALRGGPSHFAVAPLKSIEDFDARWPATYLTQCKVLTQRCFAVYKPMITSKINWLQTLCLSLIAGSLWFRIPRVESSISDIQGYMFFSTFYWMMHSHFQALNTFPNEKDVLKKERESGWYRISAFYWAKSVSELPLTVAHPTLYFLLSYAMLGVTDIRLYFCLLLMLILNSVVAQSFGLLVSVAVDNRDHSWGISAVITVFQQLFGGFLSTTLPPAMGWARYLSMVYYAYSNLCILEFEFGDPIRCSSGSSAFPACVTSNSSFIPPKDILSTSAIEGQTMLPLWVNTTALLGFLVVARLLAYLVLRYKYRPNY